MQYLADTHMHSIYSYDGQMLLEGMVKKGISLGLLYMCFTEHLEFSQITFKQFLNRYQIYREEIESLQEKYPEITLLTGVEFSNPENYQQELECVNNLNLDYIIGSNHLSPIDGSEVEILNYYKRILKMVEQGGIDSLGHLDYVRRKYDDSSITDDILKEIFSSMKKNKIVLEINSSARRRKGLDSFPSKEKLELYESSGLTDITIGSDAHRLNEIYDSIDLVSRKNENFNQGIFIERKFKTLKESPCKLTYLK